MVRRGVLFFGLLSLLAGAAALAGGTSLRFELSYPRP